MGRGYLVAIAATGGALSGIVGACVGASFSCDGAGDCERDGVVGMCQDSGYCSFPDDGCASRQRYGDHSGSLSGTCVPPVDEGDSGIADGAPTSTTTPGATSTTTSSTTMPVVSDSDGMTTGSVDVTGDTPSSTSGAGDDTTTGVVIGPDALLLWFPFVGDADQARMNLGDLGGSAECDPACPSFVDEAAVFDGTTCLRYPSSAPLEDVQALTVASWVWRDAIAGQQAFLTKPIGMAFANSWQFLGTVDMLDTVSAGIYVDDGTATDAGGGAPFGTVRWDHVALRWHDELVDVFVNGELVASTGPAPIAFDDNAIRMGCDLDVGAIVGQLTGRLDDVRVYGRALGDDEIQALAGL